MPKHVPERTCIVSRETRPQSELMRFVLGPGGEVVADLRQRLPGRGAWITPSAALVGEAVRRRLFSRAFKAEASVATDLVETIDAALVRDVAGALALANKAGAVVAGFEKVAAALEAGSAAALIHAAEAAVDGRRKLAGSLRKGGAVTISRPDTLDDLPGRDLDVALGRVGVIHAALLAGAGSAGCLARWRLLRRFRGAEDASAPPRDIMDRRDGHAAPDGQD